MKNSPIIYLLVLCAFIVTACNRDKNIICNDKAAPGPVSNPQVTNLPGAARISYTLPGNTNLLYVRAEYYLKGIKREAKSSVYTNSVLVEGFGDTEQHVVKLFAVSRCEVSSEPIEVTIQPLPPAIEGVFVSLDAKPAFGGINVAYLNPTRANIVIGVLVIDSAGDWKHVDFHYTSQPANNFSVRGFKQNPPGQPQIQYTFGVYVKDRWDNHSDTLIVTLEPIYEELLDKTKFREVKSLNYPIPQVPPLPASGQPVKIYANLSSWPITQLWNDNVSNGFHTNERIDQPIWIPFDLDQTGANKFILSRFKIWQRTGTSFTFNHGNPHTWEIWGTNTPANVNSWIKLGEWTMQKPSGRPAGDNSNEDNEVATNGQEFDFPAGLPPVRYIAWKHIDNWSSIGGYTGFFHLMEITLWGQKQ